MHSRVVSVKIGDSHCAGTEFYRMTVPIKFNFEVSIARWSLR